MSARDARPRQGQPLPVRRPRRARRPATRWSRSSQPLSLADELARSTARARARRGRLRRASRGRTWPRGARRLPRGDRLGRPAGAPRRSTSACRSRPGWAAARATPPRRCGSRAARGRAPGDDPLLAGSRRASAPTSRASCARGRVLVDRRRRAASSRWPRAPPHGVLVLPSERRGSRTPDVYAEADRLRPCARRRARASARRALGAAPARRAAGRQTTSQPAARSLCPAIDEALDAVARGGRRPVLVTAPGRRSFGLFADAREAARGAAAPARGRRRALAPARSPPHPVPRSFADGAVAVRATHLRCAHEQHDDHLPGRRRCGRPGAVACVGLMLVPAWTRPTAAVGARSPRAFLTLYVLGAMLGRRARGRRRHRRTALVALVLRRARDRRGTAPARDRSARCLRRTSERSPRPRRARGDHGGGRGGRRPAGGGPGRGAGARRVARPDRPHERRARGRRALAGRRAGAAWRTARASTRASCGSATRSSAACACARAQRRPGRRPAAARDDADRLRGRARARARARVRGGAAAFLRAVLAPRGHRPPRHRRARRGAGARPRARRRDRRRARAPLRADRRRLARARARASPSAARAPSRRRDRRPRRRATTTGGRGRSCSSPARRRGRRPARRRGGRCASCRPALPGFTFARRAQPRRPSDPARPATARATRRCWPPTSPRATADEAPALRLRGHGRLPAAAAAR